MAEGKSPGSPDGAVYGFPKADCVRISEAVRRVEKTYKNPATSANARPKYPVFAPNGLIPAKATAGFTAGSVSSPSSASVTFYVPAASGHGFDLATGDGASVTAYNHYTGTVAANALVWISLFNGEWRVVAANC